MNGRTGGWHEATRLAAVLRRSSVADTEVRGREHAYTLKAVAKPTPSFAGAVPPSARALGTLPSGARG